MKKRNLLNSPRLLELKKHRQRIFLRKILLFVFAVLILFALFAFLSRISSMNISSVEITGNKIIETETIQSIVQKNITGNYVWLFPKTNIFLYPKNNIKDELEQKFKRLKNIDVSIKDNKIIEISILERDAKYTWCGNVQVETDVEKCYFLDSEGYVFDEAPYFSGEVYFKFYGIAQPASYFSPEIFQKLIVFKEKVENIELKPVAFYLSVDGDVKLLLSKGTSALEPEIIFKIDSDFDKTAENLESAIATEPLKSNLKNKYSSLLYIDLRFGNKVYSKFK